METSMVKRCECIDCPGAGCLCGCEHPATQALPQACSCGGCGCDAAEQGCLCS